MGQRRDVPPCAIGRKRKSGSRPDAVHDSRHSARMISPRYAAPSHDNARKRSRCPSENSVDLTQNPPHILKNTPGEPCKHLRLLVSFEPRVFRCEALRFSAAENAKSGRTDPCFFRSSVITGRASCPDRSSISVPLRFVRHVQTAGLREKGAVRKLFHLFRPD